MSYRGSLSYQLSKISFHRSGYHGRTGGGNPRVGAWLLIIFMIVVGALLMGYRLKEIGIGILCGGIAAALLMIWFEVARHKKHKRMSDQAAAQPSGHVTSQPAAPQGQTAPTATPEVR